MDMQDREQLFRLIDCLRMGDQGRDHWNSYRDAPDGWGLERVPKPLTLTLYNDVKVSLDPPNLWLADLDGADLSGYNLSGAFLSGASLNDAKLVGTDLSGAH